VSDEIKRKVYNYNNDLDKNIIRSVSRVIMQICERRIDSSRFLAMLVDKKDFASHFKATEDEDDYFYGIKPREAFDTFYSIV
jgi:ssDNA-specific exonuclease RecJ